MKVLWLINIMLPIVAEALGKEASNKEGWLTGLASQLLKHKDENKVELGLCFPVGLGEESFFGQIEGLTYYGIKEDSIRPDLYEECLEKEIKRVTDSFQPDLIHAFGTEYPHTLAVVRAFERKNSILVGLQGLCYKCAECYRAGLPENVWKGSTFRDFLKQDNLKQQKYKFEKRGRNEIQVLQTVHHVTGRTDWDREAVMEQNPKVQYHFMNETLREDFYGPRWSYEKCEKHSIFMSQGNYPIKGLHLALEALYGVKKQYPDTKLYVAGDVITKEETLKDKLKLGQYGKYCLHLIKQYGLKENVCFLGRLDSRQMCDRYLTSHVFLSASVIENSPNSVGEAMLLGMPVISSNVGGVPTMLCDGTEGYLYPHFDTAALADRILSVFAAKESVSPMGEAAHVHAMKTHNPEENYKRLLEIYQNILEGNAE